MEKVKPIKAFFGRTGGKHFSKKDILPFVKDLEYDTYIEPFVGAGSIFLGRDKKVKTEIINDYDILVYNLWDGMKCCGNQLKDYKSYFMDKSVFKWYLLKEKQNRRIKKQLKEKNIENLKEDLYITKRSNPQNDNNSPIKHNEKNLCRCLLSKVLIEHKIENLKEDLFISNKSCLSMNKESYDKSLNICNCIIHKKNVKSFRILELCKCSNKNCLCNKTKEELLMYSKKIYKSIGKSKKQIEKDMGDRSVEHFFYFNGNQFLIPTKDNYNKLTKLYSLDKLDFYLKFPKNNKLINNNKNKDLISTASNKDIKIENLKEDIFITNQSYLCNSLEPNKRCKKNKSIYIPNNNREEHKIETKIEEKADEDVCVSIEKTDKGLKLIKRKFYVRNKKYKDDETKWRIHNPNLCGWNNILANCDRYYERLKDVNIFQGDYKKMLKFDSPTSLFYFDPPWTKTATGKKGNKCYSNYVELDDFYDSIKDLKGFVMISYNNDKEILEKFKKWYIVEISTTYTQKKAGKKKTIDILIMNFKDGKKIF